MELLDSMILVLITINQLILLFRIDSISSRLDNFFKIFLCSLSENSLDRATRIIKQKEED